MATKWMIINQIKSDQIQHQSFLFDFVSDFLFKFIFPTKYTKVTILFAIVIWTKVPKMGLISVLIMNVLVFRSEHSLLCTKPYIFKDKQLQLHVCRYHPPHNCPAKFVYVLLCSPFLFGKKLFSMQEKLMNNKNKHFHKQNFSTTITPINKRCVILINPVAKLN